MENEQKIVSFSPREIVSELDRYVIGQADAKKAVAIALRNRWRRQELPDELKEAISLREMDGLSYEEISELMNCPIGTVRSRIFRAREVIAEKLKPLIISL